MKAKEMFEQLGFTYAYFPIGKAHRFIRENTYMPFGTEKFMYYENHKKMSIETFKCNEDCIKAHIQMMKELGWLDD